MIRTATTLYPVILAVSEPDRALKGRDKVRRLSQLARLALGQSCRISGLQLHHLPKDEDGVPLAVGGIHWSLSHKSEVVGGGGRADAGGDRPGDPASDQSGAHGPRGRCARMALGGRRSEREKFLPLLDGQGGGFKGRGQRVCGPVPLPHRNDRRRRPHGALFDDRRWPVVHLWFDNHVAAITSHHFAIDWQLDSPFFATKKRARKCLAPFVSQNNR